jgi:hypothetical protein
MARYRCRLEEYPGYYVERWRKILPIATLLDRVDLQMSPHQSDTAVSLPCELTLAHTI